MKLTTHVSFWALVFIVAFISTDEKYVFSDDGSFANSSIPPLLDIPYWQSIVLACIISSLLVAIIFFEISIIVRRLRRYSRSFKHSPTTGYQFWDFIRNNKGYPSLSIFQFVLWTSTVVFSYVTVFLISIFSGQAQPSEVPISIIAILGISAVTLVTSRTISEIRWPFYVQSVSNHRSLFYAMTKQDDGISFARIQMLAWTIISNGIYIFLLISIIASTNRGEDLSLPDVNIFVIVTGVSSSIFLLQKCFAKTPSPIRSVTAEKVIEAAETRPLTDAARKVEKEFIKTFEGAFTRRSFGNFLKIKRFIIWYRKELQEDPDWFLSQISTHYKNEIIEDIKSFYSNSFIYGIVSEIENLTKELYDSKNLIDLYNISDIDFKLKPMEFYLEFTGFQEKIKASIVRIKFKIETRIRAQSVRIDPGVGGIQVDLMNLRAGIRLSISQVLVQKYSISYVYKPHDLDLELAHKRMKLFNLSIFDANRIVNVWIDKISSGEPLMLDLWYKLFISIRNVNLLNSNPRIESKQQSSIPLRVSLVSNSFEVWPKGNELYLPNKGNSEPIMFDLKPKTVGYHEIKIIIYYDFSLIQTLSLSLQAVSKETDAYRKSFIVKSEENKSFLPIDVISSAEGGIGGILEQGDY